MQGILYLPLAVIAILSQVALGAPVSHLTQVDLVARTETTVGQNTENLDSAIWQRNVHYADKEKAKILGVFM